MRCGRPADASWSMAGSTSLQPPPSPQQPNPENQPKGHEIDVVGVCIVEVQNGKQSSFHDHLRPEDEVDTKGPQKPRSGGSGALWLQDSKQEHVCCNAAQKQQSDNPKELLCTGQLMGGQEDDPCSEVPQEEQGRLQEVGH